MFVVVVVVVVVSVLDCFQSMIVLTHMSFVRSSGIPFFDSTVHDGLFAKCVMEDKEDLRPTLPSMKLSLIKMTWTRVYFSIATIMEIRRSTALV